MSSSPNQPFRNFKICRTTFLNYIKLADLPDLEALRLISKNGNAGFNLYR